MLTKDQSIYWESDQSKLSDLRSIPLHELAASDAGSHDVVTDLVSRIVEEEGNPALVPALMFNSTI